MKRTIKVGGSFEGVISTGPFQNARPGFYVEETFECDEELSDLKIFERQKELQLRSYENFKEAERKATIERIENERKNFRFRKLPNGKIVPSVTTILNMEKEFAIPPQELVQYSSWGTCLHGQITEYFKNGKWLRAKDIPALYVDYQIVKNGSLTLDLQGIDFPAYLEKYPFECKGYGIEVYNEEYEFAGEIDFWGVPVKTQECEDVPTIVEAKRTPTKEHFLQTAAYANCKPTLPLPWPEKFDQMMLLPLQNTTVHGFSKPMVSKDIEANFERFLSKRKKFRSLFGL